MQRNLLTSLLVIVLLAASAPAANATGGPLPGAHYAGNGGGKVQWSADVSVSKDSRAAHIDLWVPLRCSTDMGRPQTFAYEYKLAGRISAAGLLTGSWSKVERERRGIYKGQVTRQSVSVRGTFSGDRLSLDAKGARSQVFKKLFQKCASGGWVRMRATRDYPPYRLGTYAGTTAQRLPVGPIHIVYPALTASKALVGAVDRFRFSARLSCWMDDREWREERAFEVLTRAGLTLVAREGGFGFSYEGTLGDLAVRVTTTFKGDHVTGELHVFGTAAMLAQGGNCTADTTFRATWQSA